MPTSLGTAQYLQVQSNGQGPLQAGAPFASRCAISNGIRSQRQKLTVSTRVLASEGAGGQVYLAYPMASRATAGCQLACQGMTYCMLGLLEACMPTSNVAKKLAFNSSC